MDSETDGEDVMREYDTSEVDCNEDTDSAYSDNVDYDHHSWEGDSNAEIDIEEAYESSEECWEERTELESVFDEEFEDTGSRMSLELEALDEVQSKSGLEEDEYREEEVTPWCETNYSDHEEEVEGKEGRDDYRETYVEEEVQTEEEVEGEEGRDDYRASYAEEEEGLEEEPRYITFDGYHQGPEACLRWEQDMEYWLSSNNIPEEEWTSYAEETLTGEASSHWEQDAYIRCEYKVPDASWGEMRQIMTKEFVEDASDFHPFYTRAYTPTKPRRCILASSPAPKVVPTGLNLEREAQGCIRSLGFEEHLPRTQANHQGMARSSRMRMKANLLSLGAECTISRSKFCQGGGNDGPQHSSPNDDQSSDDQVYGTRDGNQGIACTTSQTTRPLESNLKIHSTTSYKKTNDRARTQEARVDSHIEHEAPPGTEHRRAACSRSYSTRPISLYSSIHQEMAYWGSSGREITSPGRTNFGVNTHAPNPPYTDRTRSSTPPSPRSYYHLIVCILKALQHIKRLPRKRSYLPKLSRYKHPRAPPRAYTVTV